MSEEVLAEDETAKCWLFSKEQIHNSPSVMKGIAFEEVNLLPDRFKKIFYCDGVLQERTARKVSCKFIAEIGQNLMYPATILAINSAKVFLNRYYMVEPLDNSPDKLFQHKVLDL
jgi:hypothetical protein